jgi:hypothetical protein
MEHREVSMLTPAFRFALELALVSIYTHSIVPIIATAPKDEADDEEVEHQEVKTKSRPPGQTS